MRPIPEELIGRPFTVSMAEALGVTRKQLRGERYTRLYSGAYVVAAAPITLSVRAAALSLVLPADAVAAKSTAALLHGADVRRHGDLDIDVTMLRCSNIRRAGVRASAAYLEAGDVVVIGGIPVTSPVRTAFDLARQRNLIDRVVGIDAMLNRGGCDLADLTTYVAERPDWRGIRWAREALTYAEPKAQSVMESEQRMHLVLGGLPRPEAQHPVYDGGADPFAFLDHAFVEWRVAPEWDGDPHRDRWRIDNERAERIRGQDWWHRRYTTASITSGWDVMVGEVRRALYDRGWRPAA